MSDRIYRPSRASPGRTTIGVAILGMHVLGIYGLARLGPPLKEDIGPAPIEVMLLSTAVAETRPPPPTVKIEEPRLDITPPVLPIELADVPSPSNNAITISAAAAPESTRVATTTGLPVVVSQVEYIRAPSPRYPPTSRRLREQGLVVLRVLIDVDGRALSVDVHESSGFERLDAEARNAVQRAHFKPWMEDGHARQAIVLVPIEFGLDTRTARS